MPKAVGYVDAYQDKKFLAKCFIPTRCYKDALEPEVNFICGRRGTGKSAIVLNIKNQDKYDYKDHIEGTQFYQQFITTLKPYVFDDNHLDCTYIFQTIWKHLILTTAMNSVIATKYKTDYDYISSEDSPIYEYLKSKRFLGKRPLSLWQKIITGLTKAILSKSNKPTFVSEVLKQVTKVLENDDFVAAEQAFKEHLSGGSKCLVIVDTILDFFKKEELFIACVEGLMYAVLDLSCEKYSANLEIKCCIPGEVYPHMKMWEKSKVKDHLIFLQWSPKDLIRMISKRLMYHIVVKNDTNETEFNSINWDNYKEVKRKVWNRYFPKHILNVKKSEEETHVYILRHTHHTPREIIRIVNEIVNECECELFEELSNQNLQTAIVKGVHEAVKSTVQELVDSNQYLIPNLNNILLNSFQSKPKVLTIGEVRQNLAASRKYWKQSPSLIEEDNVIVELIAMGFLGLVLNFHENKDYMYKTKFSYLNSDVGLDKECYLAIHPLFYDAYNINRDLERYVYPASGLIASWNDLDSITDAT